MRIDLKKDRRDLYQPPTTDFVEVIVPPMTFLTIDGRGDPNNSPHYTAAVSALYAGGYAIRFAFKARTGDELVVGPLEGLWSSADQTAFVDRRKGEWDWTMMLPLPSPVDSGDIEPALAKARAKKPDLPIDRLRLQTLDEGRSLQIMHVGSYDAETATLARLHNEVMPSLGLTWNGRHHEIYLSDPNKVAPQKMRTVLRQPVRPAD